MAGFNGKDISIQGFYDKERIIQVLGRIYLV